MAGVASFFQLATDLDPGSRQSQAEEQVSIAAAVSESGPVGERKDFFIERDGLRFAGVHLIIDLHEAEQLDDLAYVERALRDCVAAAGASLLFRLGLPGTGIQVRSTAPSRRLGI